MKHNPDLCIGCNHPDHSCTCHLGGWKGTTKTADGVTVSGANIVYWVHSPDKEFHPVSHYTAARRGIGTREPMAEMFSSKQAALLARQTPDPQKAKNPGGECR